MITTFLTIYLLIGLVLALLVNTVFKEQQHEIFPENEDKLYMSIITTFGWFALLLVGILIGLRGDKDE